MSDWRQWPISELVSYMEAAANDDLLISGAMLNKLARLDPNGRGAPFPEGTWYQVDPAGIAPAIRRIREKLELLP